MRKKKREEQQNKQTFHLTYHRVFSGRTISVECSGKEEALRTIRRIQKTINMLGSANMQEIFELNDGEKIPYQFIHFCDQESIIDIRPVEKTSA